MILAAAVPLADPIRLKPSPRPVPSHGQFVVAALGSGPERATIGTKAGSQFHMATRASVEDALAATQLLATRTGTTYAVIDPSPGHSGLTWIVPAFAWTSGAPDVPFAGGIDALRGALTGRSSHLLGFVGPDGSFDARSVPVDPTLRAPRG